MFNNQEILNKLTVEQKMELISDVFSFGEKTMIEGFDFLKKKSFKNANAWQGFPSATYIARSWNNGLIGRVSDSLLEEYKKKGVSFIELPDAKVKITPYANGLSEDPYLSGSIVREIVRSADKKGVCACLSDPLMTQEDARYSDLVPCERAIEEIFNRPNSIAVEGGVKAIKTKDKQLDGAYLDVNGKILKKLSSGKKVFYESVKEDEYVKKVFVEGCFVEKGSLSSIVDAYEKYLQLVKAFEDGEIALSDVNKACENGTAISLEMIDAVADKLLTFSMECNSLKISGVCKDKTAELKNQAMVESLVLLKNEKALPLAKKHKFALIGKIAEYGDSNSLKDKLLSEKNCIGYLPAYRETKTNDEKSIKEALEFAKKAKVVVVALGYTPKESLEARKNRTTELPANQLSLLTALASIGKKIIAVIYGNCNFDMSFDKYCSAILLAPGYGEECSKAVKEVIYGKKNPSGRLTSALYQNTEKRFNDLYNYKSVGRNDVGVFYGYRHYVTSNHDIKYPLGFGLSYTKFSYSKLKVKNGNISFTVRNSGRKAGEEVVQLYIGAEKSSIIRPKKELKFYTKVFLKKGRRRRIVIPISDLDLRVYDKNVKKLVTEDTEYTFYIGSSATDDRLKGKFLQNGSGIKPDGRKLSDFLQSKGNVLDGKYYLEEPITLPKYAKQSKMRRAFTFLFITGFLSIVYFYLFSMGWLPGNIFIYIAIGILVGVPLIRAVALKIAKNRIIKKLEEKSKIMKSEKRNNLSEEELNEEIPYEELFLEEFKAPVIEFNLEEEEDEEIVEEGVVNAVFDPDITLNKVCMELALYMKERGIYVESNSVRSIISAMASSRLLFVNSENKELLNRFINLFSSYLNCSYVTDDFEYVHIAGDDIMSVVERNGFNGLTEIASSLTTKMPTEENRIRVMALTNAESAYIKPCIAQLFKYVDQPSGELKISVRKNGEDKAVNMPENVWFMITLKEGEKVVDIPKYILESACSLDIVIREVEEKISIVKPVLVKESIEDVATENIVEDVSDEVAEENIIEVEKKISLVKPVLVKESIEDVATENIVEDASGEVAEENIIEVKQQEEPTEENIIEEERTPVSLLTYYQFTKLVEKARENGLLDETLWKRVDKLETAVQSIDATYRVSNKLWQRIEKYVSTFLLSGGEPEEALDNVMAHHVINTMALSVAKGDNKSGEKFSHIVENIFGEGHVPLTVKTVKSTGLKI